MEECQLCQQMQLREMGLGIKDAANSYYLLDSPIIKKMDDYNWMKGEFVWNESAKPVYT